MAKTLREYLSAGGRLNPEVHHDLIAAVSSSLSPDQRADKAAVARYEHETFADGGDPHPGRFLTAGQRDEAEQAAGFLADYLEADSDPELDRLVNAAISEPPALHLEAKDPPHHMNTDTPVTVQYRGVASALREPTKALRTASPEVWAGFGALHQAAVAEGVLSSKVKELMALAIAVVKQCDGCISYHARAAVARGATAEECAEALGVALLMDGGTASVYGPRAFAAFNEFAGTDQAASST